MIQKNASFVRWPSEVTAKILSILSERYSGTGSSLMPAQRTSLTWRKLKIRRASGRESVDGVSY